MTQKTIFGDELETRVECRTTGRVLRPFRRVVSQIADEYRLHVREDGMGVRVIDVADVIACHITLHSQAFDAYRVEDPPLELGINDDGFGSALQHARYGKATNDTVALVANDAHLETEVERDFAGTEATVTERTALIDAASVREDIDLPNPDLPEAIEFDTQALVQVLNTMTNAGDVALEMRDDALVFEQESDVHQRSIEIPCETPESGLRSTYTADYLGDIATALNASYADATALTFGDEFPLRVKFEREGVYDGELMVAPQRQS